MRAALSSCANAATIVACAVALLVSLASLVACSDSAPQRAKRRPNVLLISLDSTRRDHLSCYGRVSKHAPERKTSPALDSLAARGVRFDDALATCCWTLPSHVSLFSGQPLEVHAVERDQQQIATSTPLLAELLRAAGYRTAGFYSGPYLDPKYGFARGFDVYRACNGPALVAAIERATALEAQGEDANHAALRNAQREVGALAHVDRSSKVVSDAVIAELRAAHADARPFFVFAHYFDPHYDYVAPEPYAKSFDPDYAGTQDGRGLLTRGDISTAIANPAHPGDRERTCSERDLEHVLARYDAEIAWTDTQIARVLAELERQGATDDTLVIVTADHGDEFFEHGGLGHRRTLYDEVQRVPLIVAWPRGLPSGAVVGEVVSGADVVPSILEWLDVAAPPSLLGTSFAALAANASHAARRAGSEPVVAPRVAGARFVGRFATQIPRDATDASTGAVRAQLVLTLETHYVGTLEVLRERRRAEPLEDTSSADLALVQRAAELASVHETLLWIDRAKSPRSESGAWSTDFSDPRARAALDSFRARYELARKLRVRAAPLASTTDDSSALRALGYLGESASATGSAGDDLLPTPGAER